MNKRELFVQMINFRASCDDLDTKLVILMQRFSESNIPICSKARMITPERRLLIDKILEYT